MPTFTVDVHELARAGVHFGHNRSKRHPRMAAYIAGQKESVELFDLEATAKALGEAMVFLSSVASRGGLILFVGTRPHVRGIVEQFAKEGGMPFVIQRWVGGTLTNFGTVQKRLAVLMAFEEQERTGDISRYTKRERLEISRKVERLNRDLGGVRGLTRLPDALVLVTPKNEILAAHEAKKKRIPIVAIIDTNMDPEIANYPIPGNDDAISSVKYLLGKFVEAIKEGENQSLDSSA